MENIRTEFGSENLDKIFRYFMRTILHIEKTGILALPVENDLAGEAQRSYLDLALRMITDAQPEEVARPILESQYNFILNNTSLPPEAAMEMWFIRELSLHIHYDKDPSEFLLRSGNLWGRLAEEFACRTFYPNFDEEWQKMHYVDDVMAHIPKELLRPEDY